MSGISSTEIQTAYKKLNADLHAMSRRLKFFEIAVARGDPRFCKPEHARGDFNVEKFDQWAATRNLPSPATDPVLRDWAS